MKTSTTVLQNDTLSVKIDLFGAELKSITEKATGDEYLWQADPAFWGRSAPILFPIVGMLRENRYTLDGTSYSLPQHGFARDSVFEQLSCTETTATFRLQASSETLERFPFRFRLDVDYALMDDQIEIGYTVANTDNKTMFFSIGSHPAFKIPFGDGVLDDYFIEFAHEEDEKPRLPEAGLISNERVDPFEGGRIIRLHKNLFNRGAFIFKNLKSQYIAIKTDRSRGQIRVNTGGAPYLGIWSKPGGAPFVCIEPWFGIADALDSDHDFSRKEGIISLAPGDLFNCSYSIVINGTLKSL